MAPPSRETFEIGGTPSAGRLHTLAGGAYGRMLMVGVLELIAGLIVAFAPRVGAWIVFGWQWAIILNLVAYPSWYDIALRDFGLALGAAAFARLSRDFSKL